MNISRAALLFCIPLSMLAYPTPVEGSCVGSNGIQPTVDAVRIVVDSSASSMLSAIVSGYEEWNSSLCVNYLTPNPYPEFSPTASGEVTITFRLEEGVLQRPDGRTACAGWLGSSSGGTITFYTETRSSSGDLADCDFSNQGKVSDLAAHELGHFLGLSESSCDGYIMGPQHVLNNGGIAFDITPDRSIQFSECAQADTNSDTPYEQAEAQCEGDPSCDPYACGSTCNPSPIVLDLDRNQFHFSSLPVIFDIDADGELDLVTWTSPGQEDAFLALDRNRNGRIDDGAELFGNSTPLLSGHTARNGYIALGELDETPLGGNLDGRMTSEDLLFGDLLLWIDSNHNGESEPEELQTLTAAGIVEIELDYRASPRRDAMGNELRYMGRAWRTKRGKTEVVKTTDVFLRKVEE